MRTFGSRPPLFVAHGLDGRNSFATPLAEALGANQPVFTFHAPKIDAMSPSKRDLSSMGQDYAALARAVQSRGPYYLAGYSLGASLALAIARCLISAGGKVAFLGLIDEESDLDKRHFGILQ